MRELDLKVALGSREHVAEADVVDAVDEGAK